MGPSRGCVVSRARGRLVGDAAIGDDVAAIVAAAPRPGTKARADLAREALRYAAARRASEREALRASSALSGASSESAAWRLAAGRHAQAAEWWHAIAVALGGAS